MPLITITPPTAEPVALATARAHCRVDGTDDDLVLTAAIAGARALAEGKLARPLITRTVEQSFDAFPAASPLALEGTPAREVTSVTYTDPAGSEQTLSTDLYTLDVTRPLTPMVRLVDGASWPATRDTANAVRVRYTCGFGPAPADIPADVTSWLLLTIGYLYAQREAFDLTGKVADVPSRFVDSLLDAHRNYVG